MSSTLHVTSRRSSAPTLRFTPGPATVVPVLTGPGNPPQLSAGVDLSPCASSAGPIVEVTLRCRTRDARGRATTVDRCGWMEVARPWASWFLRDGEAPPEIVGARVRDLAGQVTAYGDIEAR